MTSPPPKCRTRCPPGPLNHPTRLVALPNIDAAGPQPDHSVDFDLLIVGPESQSRCASRRLACSGTLIKIQSDPLPAGGCRTTSPSESICAASPVPSTTRCPARSVLCVDADLVEYQPHVSSSFLSTLPMALRGKLSTTRTSRGRLCTESCCATKSISSCG